MKPEIGNAIITLKFSSNQVMKWFAAVCHIVASDVGENTYR